VSGEGTTGARRLRALLSERESILLSKFQNVRAEDGSVYQDRFGWYARLSAYWFASSFKWFALLTVVLPGRVASIVPEGTKNTAWGMVFAIGALWAILGPSLFGSASDRTGRRTPYIAAGAATTVAALAILAFANSLAEIAAGYLILQIADDLATGPYAALIPEHVPKERRGRASGVMSLLSLLGQLTCAPVILLARGDPRLVYGAIAVATAVGATIACRTVGPLERGARRWPAGTVIGDFLKGWSAPWRDRNFVWVWAARLMFSLGLYLTQPYLRNYLHDVVRTFDVPGARLPGADEATAVLVLTITALAAVGSVVGGAMADARGRKTVALRGGGLMAAALVPFLMLHDYRWLLGVAVLFGLGYGVYLSADWALAADVMPDESTLGRDMGIWQMSVSAVQVFAGSAGRIVDWGNLRTPGLGYQITFGLSVFAFALGMLAVQNVRPSA
jgi:MFS family permease